MIGCYPHRYYRRYARRAFRHGVPVMFIGSGEPLGLIAIAAAGKWAYRHRSAFLPFAVTTAVSILAAVAHRHHQRWWIAALAVTAIAVVIPGIPHRIMWAHPSMKFTAGIISRVGGRAALTGLPRCRRCGCSTTTRRRAPRSRILSPTSSTGPRHCGRAGSARHGRPDYGGR